MTNNLIARPSWDDIFMTTAVTLAERSTCYRLHVGCVIATADHTRILSMGYNGNIPGGLDGCDSDEPGKCGCVHAETNAIIKLNYSDASDKVMYVTHSPCLACSKVLLLSGIKEVVYNNEYRIKDGINLLVDRRVNVRQYKPSEYLVLKYYQDGMCGPTGSCGG